MSILGNVKKRYSAGAKKLEKSLCFPISYDKKYLKAIPKEVIEKDYGCGDPSKYIKKGDVVLDLGSGGGKICFIASQIVGIEGKVIGVDMTDEMLELSRGAKKEFVKNIGYDNIEFKHGYINDLKTDLDRVNEFLLNNPVSNSQDYKDLNEQIEIIKKEMPLIKDNSIDIVVSNCVLNLVSDELKKDLFQEIFRVLKVGGRIAISDIVSDEISPDELKNDPLLWSSCLTGALQESDFLSYLEDSGFYGISIEKFDVKPWHVIEGIEFRSMTVSAYKGKQGTCIEKNQALIYKGPWKKVEDDDGHIFERGKRMAICEKTFNIMTKYPYKDFIIPILPLKEVKEILGFDCSGKKIYRSTKETKSGVKLDNTYNLGDCSSDSCC